MINVHRREGTVYSIDQGLIKVRVLQQSACTGCHAKDFCCSTDCAERYIEVYAPEGRYEVGEVVWIEGEDRQGRLAVLLSFVLPLLLLVLSLLVFIGLWQMSELPAVAISLGILGLYYMLLRLFERRLRRVLRFRIRKFDQAS